MDVGGIQRTGLHEVSSLLPAGNVRYENGGVSLTDRYTAIYCCIKRTDRYFFFFFDGLAQPSSSKSGSGPRSSLLCWKNFFQSSLRPRGWV